MEQGQGQGQQGGSSKSLPTDVLVGMQAVGEALAQAGAPEQLLNKLSQAMKLYEEVLAEVSGGGQGQGQQQGRPVPAQQQGQPMSPAGV